MNSVIHTERLRLTPLKVNNLSRYVQIAKNMRKQKEQNPDYFLYTRFDYANAKNDKDLNTAAMELLTSAEKSVYPEITKRLNICLKNNYIIGYIGFLHNPNNKISSDLGIFLDPKYEHKGYAFEAQKGLLAYYFFYVDDKIYLTIHPDNEPSYQLNTKCGAEKIAHMNESKYGSERDILIITREKFIQKVFNQKVKKDEKQKQLLLDYLKKYNRI